MSKVQDLIEERVRQMTEAGGPDFARLKAILGSTYSYSWDAETFLVRHKTVRGYDAPKLRFKLIGPGEFEVAYWEEMMGDRPLGTLSLAQPNAIKKLAAEKLLSDADLTKAFHAMIAKARAQGR